MSNISADQYHNDATHGYDFSASGDTVTIAAGVLVGSAQGFGVVASAALRVENKSLLELATRINPFRIVSPKRKCKSKRKMQIASGGEEECCLQKPSTEYPLGACAATRDMPGQRSGLP